MTLGKRVEIITTPMRKEERERNEPAHHTQSLNYSQRALIWMKTVQSAIVYLVSLADWLAESKIFDFDIFLVNSRLAN